MVRLRILQRANHQYNLIIYYPLLDIDECAEDTDGCVQICNNSNGSYSCLCRSGFRLAADAHECEGSYIPHTDND